MEADVRTSFAQQPARPTDWCDLARLTIDMLPDVALLGVFDYYLSSTKEWRTLVHVCRKWRVVVFGSPRRLDLQLYCTASTPVRETLDVWPRLPISVWVTDPKMWDKWGVDNIIAALEHSDRICQLILYNLSSSQWEKVLTAMQKPFPALTSVGFRPMDKTAPVPASFLDGSGPCLRSLWLYFIPFPGLPNLLLSATHLAHLRLHGIPHSGYISPDGMVACLSVLTGLKSLVIEFESPQSRPDWKNRRPHPQTRALLPILTYLKLRGAGEYLEDLVARIDAPLLYYLEIAFHHRLIFDTPLLTQFFSRTPMLKSPDEARVFFSDSQVWITFNGDLNLVISCKQSDWQLSSLAQVCRSSFPLAIIPGVERLHILDGSPPPEWQDDVENSQWIELLRSFTAVKGLYICREFAPRVVPALQELVGERATEVLPALQSLFFEEPLPSGPVEESIGQFVTARRLTGHPIAISHWERKKDEW